MDNLGTTNSRDEGVEGLMDKAARQALFHAWATAPKPIPTSTDGWDELARSITANAVEIMGNTADARETIQIIFPNLALTPDEVPEGAVAPDPRFQFLLALKKAVDELPN